MIKIIQKLVGYSFLFIAALIWLLLAYDVVIQDLGQIATWKLYWKDILGSAALGFIGVYLLERNKS